MMMVLHQALKVTGRSALPLLRFAERWADVIRAPPTPQVKTLEQMPGPSPARFIRDLFMKRGFSRLHQLQLEGRQKYGPMWKASFGPILTVHVAEPELIQQVLRQEGQHPVRSELSSWKDYRALRGEGYGLLTAEGEEWQCVRSLLSKHMLRPQAVEAYDGALNAVVSDLLQKLKLRSQESSSRIVSDISAEFYRFGLEGISSVLFESRIGCLDAVVPVETERFIQSINTMFVMTLLTMAMPQWLHRLLPKPWDTFCRCWDVMFEFAKGHIDQRLQEEKQKLECGEQLEGRYLTYFLSQAGLPLTSVYSNVTELLLAGVDTISSTLSWSLYELSRHPDVQTALRDEVLSVMKDRSVPQASDVAAMPLLKAVVKEILRLYPVIPANARVINKDIEVGGYVIPKNTLITLCHYATSRDPQQFRDPDSFRPQRWGDRSDRSHPYATVPFGVGKRSCIGRRIAELEVYLALSRILMHFTMEPVRENDTVHPMTRTLLVPERQIDLRFTER
ncbi:25-hydroxyvitamin D-1 alpha hydroxylase, mitochondrial [Danio rerio]|uniref:25-hydroxyvitamin D-1 alpha hydroxylase, mitochondrial n=1 Tax=Danio rerio TaxID=7955 RepID=A0A097HUX0_DANRE|nr:25-hydroxyvitamin D-1 alpha hydroxylase, mitochondrial [Danio rerio]AIT52341.1 25-hydroxyvitamin D-1alpha-hydroxylase [Danio rerio]|eukprot:NP_001298720.1 cytochrome P450, family 27, subfamily B, polypeptide 1 [Danio rerio]